MKQVQPTRQLQRVLNQAQRQIIRTRSKSPEELLQSIVRALDQVIEVLPSVPVFRPPPPLVPVLVVASEVQRDPALAIQEVNGCKSLLLEIIRRAAYDWVLYRTSRRLLQKKLAEQAFVWLFRETEGHADLAERTSNGKYITSFEAICQALDLNVEAVRSHIRRLTPKNVMSVGRPAEYRRREALPHAPEESMVGAAAKTFLDSWADSDDLFAE